MNLKFSLEDIVLVQLIPPARITTVQRSRGRELKLTFTEPLPWVLHILRYISLFNNCGGDIRLIPSFSLMIQKQAESATQLESELLMSESND